MFAHLPLMIVPFILYNLGIFGLLVSSSEPWDNQLFEFEMMSGGVWAMTLGDLFILIALILTFLEVLKATRTSNASLVDHLLSTLVFVAFLVEFLLVPAAATSLFFVLMTIALVDVMAGFAVSLRAASRDVNLR